jgi:hypothetical protein
MSRAELYTKLLKAAAKQLGVKPSSESAKDLAVLRLARETITSKLISGRDVDPSARSSKGLSASFLIASTRFPTTRRRLHHHHHRHLYRRRLIRSHHRLRHQYRPTMWCLCRGLSALTRRVSRRFKRSRIGGNLMVRLVIFTAVPAIRSVPVQRRISLRIIHCQRHEADHDGARGIAWRHGEQLSR